MIFHEQDKTMKIYLTPPSFKCPLKQTPPLTIEKCNKRRWRLFEALRNVYSGYEITFDKAGSWSFDNDFARNVII